MDTEVFEQLLRDLTYSQHGGSGYSFTRADAMEMTLGEMIRHQEWLGEQRERESRALEAASKPK